MEADRGYRRSGGDGQWTRRRRRSLEANRQMRRHSCRSLRIPRNRSAALTRSSACAAWTTAHGPARRCQFARASRSLPLDEAEADDHRARPRASVSLAELRIPVKPTVLAATELTAVRVGDEQTVAPRTPPGCVGEVPAILRRAHSPMPGGVRLHVGQALCFRHDARLISARAAAERRRMFDGFACGTEALARL